MLSYHLSVLLHFGQCEGGVARDSPRGSRHTTTFRKLPMQAPRAKKKMIYGRWNMDVDWRFSICDLRFQVLARRGRFSDPVQGLFNGPIRDPIANRKSQIANRKSPTPSHHPHDI